MHFSFFARCVFFWVIVCEFFVEINNIYYRLKRITCCEMENLNEPSDAYLLVGTVTGNIFALHVKTLEFSEVVLFEENISKRLVHHIHFI